MRIGVLQTKKTTLLGWFGRALLVPGLYAIAVGAGYFLMAAGVSEPPLGGGNPTTEAVEVLLFLVIACAAAWTATCLWVGPILDAGWSLLRRRQGAANGGVLAVLGAALVALIVSYCAGGFMRAYPTAVLVAWLLGPPLVILGVNRLAQMRGAR